jgi:hypothetical protein
MAGEKSGDFPGPEKPPAKNPATFRDRENRRQKIRPVLGAGKVAGEKSGGFGGREKWPAENPVTFPGRKNRRRKIRRLSGTGKMTFPRCDLLIIRELRQILRILAIFSGITAGKDPGCEMTAEVSPSLHDGFVRRGPGRGAVLSR